jgi:hypothetical protein
MSRAYVPEDYVDVAERIRQFKERFPEGSLQSFGDPKFQVITEKREDGQELTHVFVMYCAAAYRTPDDERPGIGWAWEPVPGPTPFTKDSELMNAETSAWGRAIVALGFETKKIASAEEVRNRQENGNPPGASEKPVAASEREASPGTVQRLKETVEALQKGFPSPDPNHSWWNDVQSYMEAELGKKETGALTEAEMQQVVQEFEERLAEQHAISQVPFG